MRLCVWQWILKCSGCVWGCGSMFLLVLPPFVNMNYKSRLPWDLWYGLKGWPVTHLSPLVYFGARRQPVLQQKVQMTTCLGFQTIDLFSPALLNLILNLCFMQMDVIHHGSGLSSACFTNPHSWLSVALCLRSSFPLSSGDASFSAQQAICPFITWLSFLSLTLSLRGGLQWIFITLQVNLHYGVLCVLLLVQIHTLTCIQVCFSFETGYYILNIQRERTHFSFTAQL